MSKAIKITFIAALTVILVVALYLSFVFLKADEKNNIVTKTTTTTTTKSTNEKELDEIQNDLEASDDLDLEEFEEIDNDLGQIEKDLQSL